ncbi:MAG: InlB B-repeat-containing protein [Lachnospiraceae bacterium]|nr:InlB B-repeat-containing protein [Lachnospiraceae bacterium]
MKIKPIMCLPFRLLYRIRQVTAWLLLFCLSVGLFGGASVPAKADDTMYGIWCSTCAKYVDEFKGNYSKSSTFYQGSSAKTIYCSNCNKQLIKISSEWDEAHYSYDDGDVSTSCDSCSVTKDTTVKFPVVSNYYYSSSDEEDSDIKYSSTDNVAKSYDDVERLYEKLFNSVPLAENTTSTFTWTEWYDVGKVETSSGTEYHGLTEYLSAFGITAQRVDSYNIVYDANGGDGDMEAVSVKGGESYTLSANAFTKTGHSFAGWSTTSTGTVEYANGASITPTSDMTLYAVWEANPYDITCIDMDSTHNIELGRTTVQKSYGASVKGSDFGADKTLGTYYSGYSFTVGTSATVTTDAGSNIVYRYFEPTTCGVTLVDMVLNEDTVLGTDTTGTKLAGDIARGTDYGTASPYQGYTFSSDTSATVSADGTTVYRYFTRNNYTVAYVDVVAGENGKELGRTNVDKGFDISVSGAELGTDTTVGAYYPGYYYNGNSSTSVVTIDGATVYRYFEPAAYDVTYISVVNDVAGRELGRELKAGAGLFDSVVSGDAIGTDTTEGAYFPGYSYYASTNATVTTEGAVVYRIFKPMQYSLSLELNGGTLDDPMDSYEFGAYVELPNVYRIGYSFKGWYDNAECTGEPVTAIETGESGAKTYYALWSNDNYSIKMDYAGTGNAIAVTRDGAVVEDGSVHYGDVVTVDFGIDAGRKFNGYSITETVTDAAASGNGIIFTMPNSDVNIVTYWLECTELLAGTNAAFDAVYKVAPYWNGTAFNVDAQPAITITPDMVSVFARVYDTQTQTWSEVPVDSAAVSFVGSNVLSDINNTIFTVQTDVFGDGYNQQGSFSLTGTSGALDNAMNNSNSGNYAELEGYLNNLESDIALYEKLVIDMQNKLQISNSLKKEYAEKIAELSDELIKAQNDYAASQEKNTARIAELQSMLQTKESEYTITVDGLTNRITEIEGLLQEEGADVESLTAERDALNAQLAGVISSHNQEKSALQAELDSLNGEIQSYKDSVDSLTAELDSTRTTYETEIANLEKELDEIRTETDKLLANIEAMEETIKAILGKDDIDLSGSSTENWNKILDELKNKVDNLDNVNKDLQDEIEEKEDEIAALDKIIDNLKQNTMSSSTASALLDKNEALYDKNAALTSTNAALTQSIATQNSTIAALEAQKASLQSELNTLRSQTSTAQQQIALLQKQLEEKEAALHKKDVAIASLEAQIAKLQQGGSSASTSQITEMAGEASLEELEVKPLTLISVASDEELPTQVEASPEKLIDVDALIHSETVDSAETLAENDNSQAVNPGVIVGVAALLLLGGCTGFYFLNRRYHWMYIPF